MKRFFVALLSFFLHLNVIFGQILIINEVSQGVSGNKEYVEFVVADTAAFYDCGLSSPPCADIRGWIFDDNSGYHGSSGVAPGAIRFSNDPLWSCVDLGTIIVIYNDADPNPQILGDDLSTSDGNCVLIAPISNTSLFETNSTTPGAIACSYPPAGWTPGGNWSSVTLANGGDCARVVDLSGCEVFSVCWASNNLNTQIYFSGGSTSGSSATNTVYYFNGIDPTDQTNWTIGCADVPACGAEDQTPGFPNNSANASFIAQFNNGCMPISPITANVIVTNGCGCNGSVTANCSGSIPGYTYNWTDDSFVATGQINATATNLCSGDYYLIATSLIGCKDTIQFTIANIPPPFAGTNNTIIACTDDAPFNLLDSLVGTPDITGNWIGPSTLTGGYLGTFNPTSTNVGTYSYIVGTGTPCPDTAYISITLNDPPLFSPILDSVCPGDVAVFAIESNNATLWSNGYTGDTLFIPVFTDTTFTASTSNGCGSFQFSDTAYAYSEDPFDLTLSQTGEISLCSGDSTQVIANNVDSINFIWNTGLINDTILISNPGLFYTTGDGLCFTIYSDTLVVTIDDCEEPITTLVIPNIFTPNSDQTNDVFRIIEHTNLANATGQIMNRWGQVIKIWNGLDDSWNGRTLSGELAPDGTYYYFLEIIDLQTKTTSKTGSIFLTRSE